MPTKVYKFAEWCRSCKNDTSSLRYRSVRCAGCDLLPTNSCPSMYVEEVDPTGRGQHEPGAKLDAGKATYAMTLGYFKNALGAVDAVSKLGAVKYSHWGWLDVPNGISRYTEAALRHLITEQGGELADPDTNFLHAAHAAWNALARLELILRTPGVVSRDTKVLEGASLSLSRAGAEVPPQGELKHTKE